jgi:hypothetical protein
VDDHVVDHKHRGLDQAPVEVDLVFHRARTPAVAIVHDRGTGHGNAQFGGVPVNSGENGFPGLFEIPLFQGLAPQLAYRPRNEEPSRELDATAGGIVDLDAIVPTEIRGGLAIDQLLAGRVRAILILLGVMDLLKQPLAFRIHHLPDGCGRRCERRMKRAV